MTVGKGKQCLVPPELPRYHWGPMFQQSKSVSRPVVGPWLCQKAEYGCIISMTYDSTIDYTMLDA